MENDNVKIKRVSRSLWILDGNAHTGYVRLSTEEHRAFAVDWYGNPLREINTLLMAEDHEALIAELYHQREPLLNKLVHSIQQAYDRERARELLMSRRRFSAGVRALLTAGRVKELASALLLQPGVVARDVDGKGERTFKLVGPFCELFVAWHEETLRETSLWDRWAGGDYARGAKLALDPSTAEPLVSLVSKAVPHADARLGIGAAAIRDDTTALGDITIKQIVRAIDRRPLIVRAMLDGRTAASSEAHWGDDDFQSIQVTKGPGPHIVMVSMARRENEPPLETAWTVDPARLALVAAGRERDRVAVAAPLRAMAAKLVETGTEVSSLSCLSRTPWVDGGQRTHLRAGPVHVVIDRAVDAGPRGWVSRAWVDSYGRLLARLTENTGNDGEVVARLATDLLRYTEQEADARRSRSADPTGASGTLTGSK